MNNNEKLLSLYNELDSLLREKYHEPNRSSSVITRFENDLNRSGNNSNILIAKKIRMIRILRNDLIHELDMNKDNLIAINNDTISFLESVVNKLKHPKTARDISTPISKLFFIRENDEKSISSLSILMKSKGFSHVPVLNERNAVVGVFSPNALFNYFTEHPDEDISNLTYKDVKSYLSLDKSFSEKYCFVAANLGEEEVADIFVNNYLNNKKIAMVFVTQSGRETEPLLGVIVIKDLLEEKRS